jgi:hypothetical protein
MEKKHQLEVVKLSGGPDTYMRQLGNAVQFGFPVLIEVRAAAQESNFYMHVDLLAVSRCVAVGTAHIKYDGPAICAKQSMPISTAASCHQPAATRSLTAVTMAFAC